MRVRIVIYLYISLKQDLKSVNLYLYLRSKNTVQRAAKRFSQPCKQPRTQNCKYDQTKSHNYAGAICSLYTTLFVWVVLNSKSPASLSLKTFYLSRSIVVFMQVLNSRALSPQLTGQPSTVMSDVVDDEYLQQYSDISNPVVCIAAARCGIQIDQLQPVSLDEYKKRYKMQEIADMLFKLHQGVQRSYYKQIATEIQKIQHHGISRGEFVVFNQEESLLQYVQTKHGTFSQTHIVNFHKTLLNEASLVRQTLLKQLKTLASIEQQEQKLKQAIQLSDKEIAAKQTLEMKEAQKLEQNIQRIREFKIQSKENLENLKNSIKEHEINSSLRAEQNLNDKISTYRQKSIDLAAKQKDFIRQRDLWYQQREFEVLQSFKEDVSPQFNATYVKQLHSPIKQKNLARSLNNLGRREADEQIREQKLEETLKETQIYSKQIEAVMEKKKAEKLPFQLKYTARREYAYNFYKEKEKERQNILIKRIEEHDAPKQIAYSEHRKAIMQSEESRRKRHDAVMKDLQIEQLRKRNQERERVQQLEALSEEKQRKQKVKTEAALKQINYLKEQVRLLPIGSLRHQQAYQELQNALFKCATQLK